jgi:hypothetical protein
MMLWTASSCSTEIKGTVIMIQGTVVMNDLTRHELPQVAAASASAAASAPAAALRTAAEQMTQEVAVVRALALRGGDVDVTLNACEAALLRGLHSISRFALVPLL